VGLTAAKWAPHLRLSFQAATLSDFTHTVQIYMQAISVYITDLKSRSLSCFKNSTSGVERVSLHQNGVQASLSCYTALPPQLERPPPPQHMYPLLPSQLLAYVIITRNKHSDLHNPNKCDKKIHGASLPAVSSAMRRAHLWCAACQAGRGEWGCAQSSEVQ